MENLNLCKLCKIDFKDDSLFNKHLYKTHKINLADYFSKYYPHEDLLTGEPIKFKNREQYFFDEFASQENLKIWLKRADIEDKMDYCINLLLKRKELKNLRYSLSQVELRSLNLPSMITYTELFEDYFELCEMLGFENRFKNLTIPEKLKDNESKTILIDTREKTPMKFINSEIRKLDYGDYTLAAPGNNIYIERKSLADFVGTMSGGYERFCRELDRTVEAGVYLVILITENFNFFNNFKNISPVFKKLKSTPEFIGFRIREIMGKYNNVQFLFVNRGDEARITELLLLKKFPFQEVDLQEKYDTGVL